MRMIPGLSPGTSLKLTIDRFKKGLTYFYKALI